MPSPYSRTAGAKIDKSSEEFWFFCALVPSVPEFKSPHLNQSGAQTGWRVRRARGGVATDTLHTGKREWFGSTIGLGGRRKFAGGPDERWAGVGEKPHNSQGNASNGAPSFAQRRLRAEGHRWGVFQISLQNNWKSFGCARFSTWALFGAAVFLAEVHYTNVGEAKVIEYALADVAFTGRSSEHRKITAVAFA